VVQRLAFLLAFLPELLSTLTRNRGNLESNPLEVEVHYLKQMVDERDARIRQLESEVLFLRARIEELTPLALPRPRRWLSWLWPARTS